MNHPTPHHICVCLSARIARLRLHGRVADPALMEKALITIYELQAALRTVVTEMEGWTISEYEGTSELELRLADLKAYHRLFED